MKYVLVFAVALLGGCAMAPHRVIDQKTPMQTAGIDPAMSTPTTEIDRKKSIQTAEIEYVRQTGRLPNRAYIDPNSGKTYIWEEAEPAPKAPRLVI